MEHTPSHPASTTKREFLKAAAATAAAATVPLAHRTAWAQAASTTVHFGASLPLSGPYEKVSRVYRDGYDFWTRTVGGKINVGGKMRDVKWSIYDDENNASRSAQLTEKLLTSDNVNVLVGGYGTDTILAQGSIAAKAKRVLVQGGAASHRVDEEIGGHTAFTLVGSARVYQMLAVDHLASCNPKPRTAAIVVLDDPVYQEHAEGIRQQCAKHGIKVVFEDLLPMNVQDLRPTILKLKRAGDIDLVFNTGWDLICIKLVEEMATFGVVPKAFVGGHLTTTPTVKQTLGKRLRDVYGVTFWLPQMKYSDPHFKSPAEFLEKFSKTYGYVPSYHAALSYTLPLLYELALKDADPSDPFNQARLRERLQGLQAETVWGPVSFDARGRINMGGVPVIQWQGEDPQPKVVYPSSLAETPGIYPRSGWGV